MAIDGDLRSVSIATTHKHRPARVLGLLSERVTEGEARGDAVPRLERRIADLLGKADAAMFPTGTMAQQVAMRIHADRRGTKLIAFHPQCHMETHEQKGYEIVHGLHGLQVGDRNSLITLADLEAIAQPVAALLLELPQREIGGLLPAWEELVAQIDWTREHGVASHMDGARLWEAQPYYGRSHAEICALFDTVYVSLYKGLLGISGALLAGDADFVAHARIWRNRLGGNTEASWPMALAGERGLDDLLPRMPEFLARARRLAVVLGAVPGVQVVPEPPQTPLFHVHLAARPDHVLEHAKVLAERTGLRVFNGVRRAANPLSCSFEITVTEQLDDVADEEIRDLIGELMLAAG
jgi:threonine aldolase